MNLDTPPVAPSTPSSYAPAVALPPGEPRTEADLLSRVVAVGDLARDTGPPPPWLWHGYLGPGRVTLLTSQWKTGKTTLLSLLLARMQHGGQLAGQAVAAGKALIVSEESPADWQRRIQRLQIGDHVHLLCRPFKAQPTMQQWLALIDMAATLRQRQGLDLVAFDSLAFFLPAHSENLADAMLACLNPLHQLTALGMSVLLPHHPRKGHLVAGQAARGSGVLPSFADVNMEMSHYGKPDDLDRRRRLAAWSRNDDTCKCLTMELNAEGTDYAVLQTDGDATLGEEWTPVLQIFGEAYTRLTRQEILEEWPDDYPRPQSTTLWRWLSRAVAAGTLRQSGTGRRRDPFRYWLASREPLIRPEEGALEELEAWNQRCVEDFFHFTGEKTGIGAAAVEGEGEGDTLPPAGDDREEGPAAAAASAPPEADKPVPAPVVSPEPNAAPAPEPPLRLPFPWGLLNPAEVPEEVWQKAREQARKKGGPS